MYSNLRVHHKSSNAIELKLERNTPCSNPLFINTYVPTKICVITRAQRSHPQLNDIILNAVMSS